jgi:hypothetical protein
MLSKTLLALTCLSLLSCGGASHYLASHNLSGNDSYEVNSYFGCCGCQAKYFDIKSGKRIVEQVVYSYNCSSIGAPTKFVFNYDKRGRIVSCDKYVATMTNDFTIALSDYEKNVFSVIDTSSTMKANYTISQFSEIKGFRKAVDKEITHLFPIVRKGEKLPVN